jgi:hypothetical protein
MTDRAEPGVTPLTETDIANVREVLDSQVRLGHAMTLMPTDVLARILDAATPRPGLVEALEVSQSVDQQVAGRVEVNQKALLALASGTGEPGLDVESDHSERCLVSPQSPLTRRYVHANDKGADR